MSDVLNPSKLTVKKDYMRLILSKMAEKNKLIAPVSNGKAVDFLEVSDVNNVLMGDEIPYKSPKEFFFPRFEKIMEFTENEAIATKPEKGVVIFGVKPCDLEALKIMTKVFTTGNFPDPFFKAHLDNTLLIGVGCVEEKPGCFCSLRETDMKFSESCDLFLENDGDNYNVVYVSEKGREALSEYIPDLDSIDNKLIEKNTKNQLTLEGIENAEEDLFAKIDWESITDICQGCGMCTYICPTCHCFGFKDIEDNGNVSRYRCWDSCMFPKFTLHASGHNPRDTKIERYRQRVLHKYVYIKKNFDYVACTGCGRCVRSCPAGMNIKNVVEGIMGELK